MADRIQLVEIKGETSIRIEVEITDDGGILFSGQDTGDAPLAFWGEEDYEYWLKIDAADKDRVLLALIEELYSGNAKLISEFKCLLGAKGIPSEFSSYV
jgi:hypothetical protein